MKNSTKILTVLTVSLFFLGGCASQIYHDYIMSGQVVSTNGNELVAVSYTHLTLPTTPYV